MHYNEMQILEAKKKYENKLFVVKFGGALAEDMDVVSHIANQIYYLSKTVKCIFYIVHGGGKSINQALKEAGIEIVRDKKTGLRITNQKTLAVSDRSLRDLNKAIVRCFNTGLDKKTVFFGAAGYDHKGLVANAYGLDLGGYTGHSPIVNVDYFHQLINPVTSMKSVPIVYPICWNDKAKLNKDNRLNVNADDVASAFACQMNAAKLIVCSDVPGVLNDKNKLILEMSPDDVDMLIENGVVTGGMVPKVKALKMAANRMKNGAAVILDGRKPTSIIDNVMLDIGSGTLVSKKVSQMKFVEAPRL